MPDNTYRSPAYGDGGVFRNTPALARPTREGAAGNIQFVSTLYPKNNIRGYQALPPSIGENIIPAVVVNV